MMLNRGLLTSLRCVKQIKGLNSLSNNSIKCSLSSVSGGNNTEETYTQRQAKLGRPVSPHVTIYAFPITAISSITNRVTGVGLVVGTSAAGTLALFGADVPAIAAAIGTTPVLGTLAKGIVSFPIVYHYLGGVRHIAWDSMPETLTNKEVEQSSYALFGVTSIFTACLMFM